MPRFIVSVPPYLCICDSESPNVPDLECQIGYSAILSVKFSWALGQTENTPSKKGEAQPFLGWLYLQITKKTMGTPFPNFLQDRGAGSGSSMVQQPNSSPHEQ